MKNYNCIQSKYVHITMTIISEKRKEKVNQEK